MVSLQTFPKNLKIFRDLTRVAYTLLITTTAPVSQGSPNTDFPDALAPAQRRLL